MKTHTHISTCNPANLQGHEAFKQHLKPYQAHIQGHKACTHPLTHACKQVHIHAIQPTFGVIRHVNHTTHKAQTQLTKHTHTHTHKQTINTYKAKQNTQGHTQQGTPPICHKASSSTPKHIIENPPTPPPWEKGAGALVVYKCLALNVDAIRHEARRLEDWAEL